MVSRQCGIHATYWMWLSFFYIGSTWALKSTSVCLWGCPPLSWCPFHLQLLCNWSSWRMRLHTYAYLTLHWHLVVLGVSRQIKFTFLVRGYANVTDCQGPQSPRHFFGFVSILQCRGLINGFFMPRANDIAPYYAWYFTLKILLSIKIWIGEP